MFMAKNTKSSGNSFLEYLVVFLMILGFWYYIDSSGFQNTFSFLNSDKTNEKEEAKEVNEDKTRTILVYMVPSNLESEKGLATNDLMALKKDEFDFEHDKFVVMAGGTKKWFNSFSVEPKIYEYHKNGVYDAVDSCVGYSNMGEASTLSYFLSYVKKHYESDEYILFFYGHGWAVYGLLPDEVYDDSLTLEELNRGFQNSLFNSSKEKIDLVITDTCLMGTIETFANLSHHANYVVATEEEGWLMYEYPLFDILNDLEPKDDAKSIAKKYIDAYEKSVKSLTNEWTSMSLIDLSQIPKLYEPVNQLFGKIPVYSDYDRIKEIRREMIQLGKDTTIDEVDLSAAMQRFSLYDEKSYFRFQKQLPKTVLYHYSNHPRELTGISIWFPYFDGSIEDENSIGSEFLYEANSGYRNFVRSFIQRQKEEYS